MPSIEAGMAGGMRWTWRPLAADASLADEGVPGDVPVPSLAEIVRQRQLAGQPVALLELEAATERVVWPLAIERRTLRGVPLTLIVGAGDNFFDYLPLRLPAGFDFSCLLPVLDALARGVGCDGVLLPHCVAPWPDGSARWRREYANRCFDAEVEAKGWDVLARKESLRRHRNRARKTLDYRVEHFRGPLPESLAEVVAALHRERWAFDGIVSLFADPRRAASYAACGDRLLTTVVRDGETVLAAHIGMRFGTTLIWHTPVINLRYLGCSPLEVLLLETVEECARLGLKVIDYGLGDEAYKSRFSNVGRPVADLFMPTSARGWVAHFLLRTRWAAGWRARLSALRQLFAVRRERSAGIRLHLSDRPVADIAPASACERVIDFARLVDLFRLAGWELRREHHDLLRQGEVFLYHEADGQRAGLWVPDSAPAGVTLLHRPIGGDAALLHLLAGAGGALADTLLLPADRSALVAALSERGWRRAR